MKNKITDNYKHRFWKQRFRITIQEESTFHERRAYLLSGRRIFSILGSLVLSIVMVSYITIAHTPLTEYLVPGYIAKQYRKDAKNARIRSDSALKELSYQEKYLSTLKYLLKGEVPVDSRDIENPDRSTDIIGGENLPAAGVGDLSLRDKVEKEDRFALRKSGPETLGTIGFNFQPVSGAISDGFNITNGHHGVDIEAPEGVLVHSVDDGAILFADFTIKHGYVIAVQHRNGRVSVYKHNSSLLKDIGDIVRMGDVIASVGNSGTQTSGPHLHFEWWVEGQPVDPAPWLRLGE